MEQVAEIEEAVTSGLAYIGSLATLACRAAYFTFVGPFRGKPLRLARVVSQAMEVGVRALPILTLITFFIGLILALQSAYELRKFGALNYVASAVGASMTRELGPLITAILVIGRSGSAFAAEIGTMKVAEKIDALETMAISPTRFLVTPKFMAMIIMLPCLTIWANFMGIVGEAVFGVAQADFTWSRYIRASVDALYVRDIATGLVKSVMFGMTMTAVGCHEGLSTGAEQVGRAARSLDELKPGGLGLHFIRTSMDVVSYVGAESANRLRLVRYFPGTIWSARSKTPVAP